MHPLYFCVPRLWVPPAAGWRGRLTDNWFSQHYKHTYFGLKSCSQNCPQQWNKSCCTVCSLVSPICDQTRSMLWKCSTSVVVIAKTSESMRLHTPRVIADLAASRSRKLIISFCTATVKLHLSSLYKKAIDNLKYYRYRTSTKMPRDVELNLCEKTEGTGLLQPGEERALRDNLTAAF